jgi:hypothetical protein
MSCRVARHDRGRCRHAGHGGHAHHHRSEVVTLLNERVQSLRQLLASRRHGVNSHLPPQRLHEPSPGEHEQLRVFGTHITHRPVRTHLFLALLAKVRTAKGVTRPALETHVLGLKIDEGQGAVAQRNQIAKDRPVPHLQRLPRPTPLLSDCSAQGAGYREGRPARLTVISLSVSVASSASVRQRRRSISSQYVCSLPAASTVSPLRIEMLELELTLLRKRCFTQRSRNRWRSPAVIALTDTAVRTTRFLHEGQFLSTVSFPEPSSTLWSVAAVNNNQPPKHIK